MTEPPGPNHVHCAVLFDYPERSAVGTLIPKARIVARSRTRGLRDRLSGQVADIRWAFKLAPVSLNLPAGSDVQEIQVFRVTAKPGVKTIPATILKAIDQAVPSPIIFEVAVGRRVRTVAAFKRPNEADAGKQVLGEYLWSETLSIDAPRQPLPVAVDMANLYRELMRSLIPLPARKGEGLREHLDRLAQVRAVERECAHLQASMAREQQFNRKVEINRHLREQSAKLARLRGGMHDGR